MKFFSKSGSSCTCQSSSKSEIKFRNNHVCQLTSASAGATNCSYTLSKFTDKAKLLAFPLHSGCSVLSVE